MSRRPDRGPAGHPRSVGAGKGYGGQHSQTLEVAVHPHPRAVRRLPGHARRREGPAQVARSGRTTRSSSSRARALYATKGDVPEGELPRRRSAWPHVAPRGHRRHASWPGARPCPTRCGGRRARGRARHRDRGHRPAQPRAARHGDGPRVGAQDGPLRGRRPGRPDAAASSTRSWPGSSSKRSTISTRPSAGSAPPTASRPRPRAWRRRSCPNAGDIVDAVTALSSPTASRPRARRDRPMAHPILMPKPGQMTEECVLIVWHKEEGDAVHRGDVLFEIETDKSRMEVESFEDGVLLAQARRRPARPCPVNAVCALDRRGRRGRPRRARRPAGRPSRPAAGPGASGPRPRPRPAPAPGPRLPSRLRRSAAAAAAAPAATARASRSARAPAGLPRTPGIDPRTRRRAPAPAGESSSRTSRRPSSAGRSRRRPPRPRRRSPAAAGPAPAAGPPAAPASPIARRSRRGGAAAAEPDAPRHRRPADPQRDDHPALHGHGGRRHDQAVMALRAELKAGGHDLTVTDFIARGDGPDAGGVPGRQLPDRRRAGLPAPPGPSRARRLGARRARRRRSSATPTACAGRAPRPRRRPWPRPAREGTIAARRPDRLARSPSRNLGHVRRRGVQRDHQPGRGGDPRGVERGPDPASSSATASAVRQVMKLTLSADHRLVDGETGARFLNALRRRLEDVRAFRDEVANA